VLKDRGIDTIGLSISAGDLTTPRALPDLLRQHVRQWRGRQSLLGFTRVRTIELAKVFDAVTG